MSNIIGLAVSSYHRKFHSESHSNDDVPSPKNPNKKGTASRRSLFTFSVFFILIHILFFVFRLYISKAHLSLEKSEAFLVGFIIIDFVTLIWWDYLKKKRGKIKKTERLIQKFRIKKYSKLYVAWPSLVTFSQRAIFWRLGWFFLRMILWTFLTIRWADERLESSQSCFSIVKRSHLFHFNVEKFAGDTSLLWRHTSPQLSSSHPRSF